MRSLDDDAFRARLLDSIYRTTTAEWQWIRSERRFEIGGTLAEPVLSYWVDDEPGLNQVHVALYAFEGQRMMLESFPNFPERSSSPLRNERDLELFLESTDLHGFPTCALLLRLLRAREKLANVRVERHWTLRLSTLRRRMAKDFFNFFFNASKRRKAKRAAKDADNALRR